MNTMPKRPKLPGAADFFAMPEAEPDLDTPEAVVEETPVAARPSRVRSSQTHTPVVQAVEPIEAPPLALPPGPTEKVSFYLNPTLLKRLELLKAQLLVEHNLKINRSQIIELLLAEGLQEVEALTEKLLARAI
jgi:hypothetical protein